MIAKGIVSAIYEDQNKISVILPEYDNMTTQPLQIYGTPNMSDFSINEFVVVVVFNGDFNDAVILPKRFATKAEIIEMLLESLFEVFPDGDEISY